jgi:hypothetical protein
VQLSPQLAQRFNIARGHHLDLAGVGVSHPTVQPKLGRLAMHEPAKPNPLHTPANEKVKDHVYLIR